LLAFDAQSEVGEIYFQLAVPRGIEPDLQHDAAIIQISRCGLVKGKDFPELACTQARCADACAVVISMGLIFVGGCARSGALGLGKGKCHHQQRERGNSTPLSGFHGRLSLAATL